MRVVAVMVMILVSASASADESAPPPEPLTCKASTECPASSACSVEGVCVETSLPKPAAPVTAKVDAVVLKSGERVEGVVKEQVRGRYVVIEQAGVIRTLMWDAIAEIQITKETEDRLSKTVGTKPTTIEEVPKLTGKALQIGRKTSSKKRVVKISTTTGFNANREGAGFSRVKECKNSLDDPTCKETTALTVGREGPKASYSSEVDCSKQPGSHSCTEKKQIGVSGAGFGASYTKEELVAVDEKKRPSSSVNFGIAALVGGGAGTLSGSEVSIFMANFDASIKILAGGKFPSKRGGGWLGIALEPTVGFVAQSFTSSFMGMEFSSSATGVRAGGTAAVQLMYFGKMNDKTLKQRGIGLFVGVFAGGQSTKSEGQTEPTTSSSVGPTFGLVFPNYNAGTAKYKSTSINIMILPTGGIVFVTAGLATAF